MAVEAAEALEQGLHWQSGPPHRARLRSATDFVVVVGMELEQGEAAVSVAAQGPAAMEAAEALEQGPAMAVVVVMVTELEQGPAAVAALEQGPAMEVVVVVVTELEQGSATVVALWPAAVEQEVRDGAVRCVRMWTTPSTDRRVPYARQTG